MADLLTEQPVPGVQLTLCSKLDGDCALPIAQYESNQDGKLDVELPAGFDGYLQTEGTGIYPTMFFPSNTNRQRPPSTLPIVPASFMGRMIGQLGVTLAEDRAVVMTTALDCSGIAAAGIALDTPQADSDTVRYYVSNGLPSRDATQTDVQGVGGFVNVKPGPVVLTTTITTGNRLSGTVAVQTRAGYASMVQVVPDGG